MQYDAIREMVKVLFYTLKQVWNTAEFILENYEIQWLICGKFCVPDADVILPLQFFSKVVAAAEKEDLLETFILTFKLHRNRWKYQQSSK